MLRTLTLLAALSLPVSALPADQDPLLKALKTELDRSFSKLKDAEKVPLYFLHYGATDTDYHQVGATLGALSYENSGRERRLDADARFGSPALDNTHELKGAQARQNTREQAAIDLPLGDDEAAIRARAWELTDAAYKAALDRYAKVRTNIGVTAEEKDKSGDFSPASAETFYSPVRLPELDKAGYRGMARRLSAKFKKHGFIIRSGVSLNASAVNRYMVNSEGSAVVTGNNYLYLSYYLTARTKDGMDLSRGKFYHSDGPAGIPGEAEIAADIDRSVSELAALLGSEPSEPLSVPAILDGPAAGLFFHEIFGHRIEGHRQKSESEGQTFAKMIGQRIMPEFLRVYDDPSVREVRGQFLRGYYTHDDEAVKAARASLVENGVLKGFLMGRTPIEGFPSSNGHGRRSAGKGAVARQGNLIVEASATVPYPELRGMLLEEIKKSGKPYGLLIKDIYGGFTITQRVLPQSFTVQVLLAYKVYADGRPDEAVRGLNLIGTPIQTFSRIKAAADDAGVFNGDCGAESGWVPVSAVSPSLLFSEIETEKVSKSNNKPPLLPPPYAEGQGGKI
ncbi:MAG: metallopeptidase TldD-related protein [Elusimicrobiales bacterium]|jgi:predicted Zn-dependent protease|nr:metallopeptidase TldD-related protein [Elusimicrobiales bacterium]